MEVQKITQLEKDIFYYLNDLRESGVTNMYGATSYIIDEFEIENKEAIQVLSKWMKLFNERGYEHLIVTN